MGAGKTAIGKELARRLHRPFLDSDHEVVARAGVSIPTIFDIEGEAGFRCRESRVIAELTGQSPIVMATGGGAILSAENRRRLHDSGWVVYLCQAPEILHERTRCSRNRPMLDVADPLARLRELYALRDPLYRQTADLVVEAPTQGIQKIAQEVLEKYRAAPERAAECREIAVR